MIEQFFNNVTPLDERVLNKLVSAVNESEENIGDLDQLKTDEKGNLVTAVNESVTKIEKLNKVKLSISENEWVSISGLYEKMLVHNLNKTDDFISVKFMYNNSHVFLDYEFIDNNTIKIYSNVAKDIDVYI